MLRPFSGCLGLFGTAILVLVKGSDDFCAGLVVFRGLDLEPRPLNDFFDFESLVWIFVQTAS